MTDLLLVLQVAIALSFGGLAARSAASWIRETDRRHGYLAIALGSLALLILIAPLLGGGAGGAVPQSITDVAIVLFLFSGYALLMFRDTFLPFARATHWAIIAALAVVAAFAIAVQLPADPMRSHTELQTVALVAVVVAWTLCILEPTIRFWLAARERRAVEAARLRALSAGYAGILLVVIMGTVGAGLGPVWTFLTDLIALAVVPILYVSFAPPVWLRRVWRQPEEDEFRSALHDLLVHSPDRETLARRALAWAQRLVGGESAFVIDSDRSILATQGLAPEQAAAIAESHDIVSAAGQGHQPWRREHMLVVPLDLERGRGAIVITSGRLTPVFGDDELSRLLQYAGSVTAGLDRVTLSSRIQALEKAKSDFLNIASHELRGPMTIIKGYLTMLEGGALGDLPAKAESVLPLLISKSDEITWMLEQMVEASRLEEGRLELNKRPADVVEITDTAIEGVKLLLRGHDLKLDEPAEPLEADIDPDRFQMVVRNLLTNAAKYSPSGTDIVVRIARSDRMATVSVIDQGVGISLEDQAGLFTRFNRVKTTQHVQGTGLGLWLSREIARMHDGDLTVQSIAGRGSTFVLAVPLKQ
jgi:signal transduction histidine kinase